MTGPLDRYRLHYRGDRTDAIGQLVGPNTLGEWFVIVSATYDAETDRTTARLRFATVDEVLR